MKKHLYFLALFLLAGSAWALEPVKPQDACSRVELESNQIACNQIIASGAKFDELAVGVCDDLIGSLDTVKCMRTIENGTFESRYALEVCDRLGKANDIIECIGALAFDHIQNAAVSVCDGMNSKENVLECMEAIVGKTYTQDEIDECKRKDREMFTVDCFEESGKINPNDLSKGRSESSKKHKLDISKFIEVCPPAEQNSNGDVKAALDHLNAIIKNAARQVK